MSEPTATATTPVAAPKVKKVKTPKVAPVASNNVGPKRRVQLVKYLQKIGATKQTAAASMKAIYPKVDAEPRHLRVDIRNMVESGLLKKIKTEDGGVSIYLGTSKIDFTADPFI